MTPEEQDRASLQPQPRYKYRFQYRGIMMAGIYDTQRDAGPMTWETCADVMNLADRYERVLRAIGGGSRTGETWYHKMVELANRALENK